MMICLLAVGTTTLYAQHPGHKKDGHRKERREKMQELTPQQRAELKTKRMTLNLDLTPKQQTQILQLNVELETNRENNFSEKKKEGKLSANKRFERTSKMLDDKIATKKKLKSILTEGQFEKFQKAHFGRKKGRRQHFGGKKR